MNLAVLVLPILLVHGYAEDSHVWDSWVNWLKNDGFNATAITFQHDDECGTVAEHATELNKMIKGKVIIIAHSKGGLDARWTRNDKISQLYMIGTPNRGTESAYIDLTHCGFRGPGLEDLLPGSAATQVKDQPATKYYTIAGTDHNPCLFVVERPICFLITNDGFVTVESAKGSYPLLAQFPYSHVGLLMHKDVYDIIHKTIINRTRG